jgi:hypothetical protein
MSQTVTVSYFFHSISIELNQKNTEEIMALNIKGIVSQDWGMLQMVLLDRYRVLDINAWGLLFFKSR